MHRPMTRRDFLKGGGKALLGAGLAGSLLAGCGGSGGGSGQITYWLALPGGEEYYRKNVLPAFEKAHPGVQDVFYQVFDKGVMDDAEGREIDFRNTLIILTSNQDDDSHRRCREAGARWRLSTSTPSVVQTTMSSIRAPCRPGR